MIYVFLSELSKITENLLCFNQKQPSAKDEMGIVSTTLLRALLLICVKVPAGYDGHLPGQGAKRKSIIPRRNFDAPT